MIATTIALNIFSLEEDGFHPKLEVGINGQQESVILDTGASKTAFDLQQLSKLLSRNDFQAVERLSTGLGTNTMQRSEERRGGKECVSTCRSRRSTYH